MAQYCACIMCKINMAVYLCTLLVHDSDSAYSTPTYYFTLLLYYTIIHEYTTLHYTIVQCMRMLFVTINIIPTTQLVSFRIH